MVDQTVSNSDSIETESDMGSGDAGLWAFWQAQVQIYDKEAEKFIKRGRKIVKRYRDERPDSMQSTHQYNSLWSNVQTLKPVLYARTPKPDIERRFKDQDDVGRLASTLLERSLSYQCDMFDFDDVMGSIVLDRLLPGRGIARVIYIPHFGDELPDEDGENAEFEEDEDAPSLIDNAGDEKATPNADAKQQLPTDQDDEPLREVVYEEVKLSYVFWEDYREGPARKWVEVPWVSFDSYMTRDELVARFKRKGKNVNLDFTPKGGTSLAKEDPPEDIYKKAKVREIWDKVHKRVIWLSPGTPNVILDQVDDPLGLEDFFPNPDPLQATLTNDKRFPVADYIEYQDQARELDTLTGRIDVLTRALKVSGVYPGDEKQVLQQLVDEGTENRLIPVHDWARWTDKGGLDGFIQWMPIKQIGETLIALYQARDKVKETLYEISGIGDIMRGNTSPDETATAQLLKTNFVTRRVEPQQRDVAKFAKNSLRLMAQVVANHFESKTISMITGFPQLDPVPQSPPAPQQMIPAPAPPPQQAQQPGQPPSSQGAPMQPQAQPGSNVIPMPQQQMRLMPNPAFGQWQQVEQQVQAIQAKNAQKQKQFDDACALIRKDGITAFRLDIEADSTIAPDEQQEKAARTEFLEKLVPLMETVIPMAQGNPPLAALAKEIVLFAVRGFRVGRPLEEAIENAMSAIAQMPPNPAAQGKGKGGTQTNVDSPADLALRKQEMDSKTQLQQQANSIKGQQVEGQLAIDAAKLQQDGASKSAELALEAQAHEDERQFRSLRGNAIEGRSLSALV